MNELNPPSTLDEARLLAAAAWRVRLSDAGMATSAAFETWLTDPENAKAWAQVHETWDYMGAVAGEPEIVAARHAALGDAQRASAKTIPPLTWRAVARLAAALVLVVLGCWGGLAWLESPSHYRAEIGERRVITLDDGSRISLDSSSEVTVKYSRTARELHLVRGQARFDVAHDVERPFSVVASDRKIVATGTAFNIDIAGKKMVVTLLQGRVAVLRQDEPSQRKHAIELEAGQQFVEVAGAGEQVSKADLLRATAWTNGQLIFANETLADVVEHMNRYTTAPIVIADARVGAMRISGVFNGSDAPGFVDTVTNYLPVQADTDAGGRIVLKPRK